MHLEPVALTAGKTLWAEVAGLLAEVVVLNAAAADVSSVVDGVLAAAAADGSSVVSMATVGLGSTAVVHAAGTGAVSVLVVAAVNVSP